MYRCKQRGATPCPLRRRARPYHCSRHGTMAHGTTPRRMLGEVVSTEVGGVAPSHTVAVPPSAATSRSIVPSAAPSRVLVGAGHLTVSSMDYPAPSGHIAVGVCPAAQRSRFAQYPAPRPAVSSQYDLAPRSAISLLQHDVRHPTVSSLLYPAPFSTERRALVGPSSPTRCPPCLLHRRWSPLNQCGRHRR